jgi:hypothetical protein
MFTILNIEYKGYAATSCGGVSFIINIQADPNRFLKIWKIQNPHG